MKNLRSNWLSLLFLLVTPFTYGLSSDKDQPIYIDSDTQNLDIKNNIVTFTGNVFLRQGSIRLTADKIVVSRPTKKENAEVINAYGQPSRFQQTMDDGEKISGQAIELRYETAKNLLTMTKDAVLIQGNGNKIESEKMTYDTEKQLLAAESESGKRVTTILQPQSRK